MRDKQPTPTRIWHTIIAGIVLAAIFAGINTYNSTTLIKISVERLIDIQEAQIKTMNEVQIILAEFRKDKKHIVYRVDGLEVRMDTVEDKVYK